MRIAIMQPYFLPYAGYFRLFSETDLFVIYDCVQFMRRGWVHRNRLRNQQGELSWLTLPLLKAPQDTRIADMAFSPDANILMQEQQNKFPLFQSDTYRTSDFCQNIPHFEQQPVQYISTLLNLSCRALNIPFNVFYSSQLKLDPELRGQNRIIAIAKHFNANTYINAPSGKELYNKDDFQHHNIDLQFLPDYQGSFESILPRLFTENIDKLRHEILSQGVETAYAAA